MEDFQLKRTESGRHFEHIDIGCGMHVSIQAGEGAYSTPRITHPSSDEYSEFEVALMLFDQFYHPHINPDFAERSWASYWSQYDEVASYMPRAEVGLMLSDLRRLWKPGFRARHYNTFSQKFTPS